MRVTRLAFLAVFVGATALVAGCGSNNKDKIVGKWKLASGANVPPEAQDFVGNMYLEFKADGKVAAGVLRVPGNPMLKEMPPDAPTSMDFATYKLLSGDGVEIRILPEIKAEAGGAFIQDGRVKIKIDGDKMTMIDAKDTINLTRVK